MTAAHETPASQILFVWSARSKVGRENLEWGRATATWGFKHRPEAIDRAQYILFGTDFSSAGNGSPRQQDPQWQVGTATLILGVVNGSPFIGKAPHWPDETDEGTIIYPHRVGFTEIGQVDQVKLAAVLEPDAITAMRVSATTSRAIVETAQLDALLKLMGIEEPAPAEPLDLSRTAGTDAVDGSLPRSDDPELRAVVEKHSVKMATEHLETQGWDVRELGKPYDLVCTRPDGSEKHVEVKGTTGAGTNVNYTPNEVRHFRMCPHGADLIVVRDIQVDKRAVPYLASGGELLHVKNYMAPSADLQASAWVGRVDGWP